MSQIDRCPKVDLSVTTSHFGKSIEHRGLRVIADHFEKISSIYRKRILKTIADHF
jgi:hypothetical protein